MRTLRPVQCSVAKEIERKKNASEIRHIYRFQGPSWHFIIKFGLKNNFGTNNETKIKEIVQEGCTCIFFFLRKYSSFIPLILQIGLNSIPPRCVIL